MTTRHDSEAALELTGLTKNFGGTLALNDLGFSVRQGEIFGFVGSNGAGKTTTMRIVLGVLSADRGEVLWNGGRLDLEARRNVGYMPEERGLYPKMKVGEQLVYLAQLHGLTPQQAQAATERWTDRLGLRSRIQDEVQALSLGNQQRVQLAAALVHDPRLLILDEPFSGLDPVAVDVMSSVLRERADEGVPVIFSSHQLELVERLCDRVGIVSRGEMVAVGTIGELRQTEARRYAVGADRAMLHHAAEWVSSVPGATLVAEEATRVVIELHSPRTDEQALLHAALRSGPVLEFTPVQPTLAELFRDVVSADPGDENTRAKVVA